jgi:hypothetical protein
MIAKDLEVLAVPLKDLKLQKGNARKGDVDAIKRSYERFGQRKPIVAHKKTKAILAGNHQYQAAKDLGWDKIAVVWVEDDAETAKAFSIADNRIGQLGEWDLENLVSVLDELDPNEFETVGFSEVEVEDFRALLDESKMEEIVVIKKDDENDSSEDGSNYKKDVSYQEYLERYGNRGVRSVILYYPNEEYGRIVEDLKTIGELLGSPDNAKTVELLVKEKLANG